MRRKLFLISLVVLLSLLIPHPAHAAPSCSCILFPPCDIEQIPQCLGSNNQPDPNYIPYCTTNQVDCDGGPNSCTCQPISFTPTPIPTQPPSCAGLINCCRCSAGQLLPDPTCVDPKVPECLGLDSCTCKEQVKTPTPNITTPEFKICETIPESQDDQRKECEKCLPNGVYTALGCLPTSPQAFASTVLTLGLGIGGGLALLLMLYGSFLVSTSAGNPEQSQKGKAVVSGAIMGLLFIIFSVVLLKIIGIDILHLPGL